MLCILLPYGPFYIYAESEPKPNRNHNSNQIVLFRFRQTFHIWTESVDEILENACIIRTNFPLRYRNTFTIQIVPCHCLKFMVFVVALGLAPQKSVVSCL